MPTLPPVPNTPLRDDPTQDSIWKRWFQLLKVAYSTLGTVTSVAVSGGTTGLTTSGGPITTSGTITLSGTLVPANGGTGIASYAVGDILYADTTTTLEKLADVATKQVLVSGGVNTAPAWSPNLTLSGDLSVEGNTTLGDASGDSLTTNYGTVTYNSNISATRTVTLPAGVTNVLSSTVVGTGDSGGTTNVRGHLFQFTTAGSSNFINVTPCRFSHTHPTTATVATSLVHNSSTDVTGSSNITTAIVYNGSINLTSSGSVSNGSLFVAAAPTLSSTGTIGTLRGVSIQNLGHASLVTANAIGVDVVTFTVGPTTVASFRSAQNTGTGCWGYLHTGTANNGFNGNVRIGSTVAPTVALDVTGAALISSTLGVTGALSANTIQVLTGTTATVYNTAATTVNAFGGATTLTMGAATGTATIANATVTLSGATTLNVNGANPTLAGSSTGTLTLFNTALTTVNAFGAATTITIGASTGTTTLGNTLVTAASTTGREGIRIPSGTAPTSPTSGAFWYDGSALKFQDGGTTRTITWV